MHQYLAFKEELISQIPALQLLKAMGYRYLTPAEALAHRGGKLSNVILEDILEERLRVLNWIEYKGNRYPFSEANLKQAIQTLKNEPYDGLVSTNERIYELLTLGVSLRQTIAGDTKSYSLRYIDWGRPENNHYHLSDEFPVEKRLSKETRRPDIVLFVNGIPLVVIECKRPDLDKHGDKAVTEAISQMIRNQKDDEIPNFFIYSQLLLGVSKNDALYATTFTPKKFWAVWKEEPGPHPNPLPKGEGTVTPLPLGGVGGGPGEGLEAAVQRLINIRLTPAEKDHLYNHRDEAAAIRRYFDSLEAEGERLPTAQDRTLYSLLRPERLLELIYQFIVYDKGIKKIARYQQYFAIKATLDQVAHLNHQGQRTGGVIWHTTGSGKSLTMVMLAKALALHPNVPNPRIVLVTDRIDLDDQIWKTFNACGKKAEKAGSGRHLIELVQSGKVDIITTVINKFEAAAKEKVRDHNPNIFVLVDEGHRSQYGTIHAKMRQVFKKACYLGFTGTPLLKKDKTTAQKFGDFIHKYSMRKAVEDQAVVPLLYEGRLVEQEVDQDGIDKWFERVTKHLTEEQKADLKRKFSRSEEVNKTEQRLKLIAYDLTEHYVQNFQGSGFKAQLAAPNKRIALKYKQFLDEFGEVTSEVIISAPDTREGNDEVDNSRDPELEAFWKRMMERYKSEDEYNRAIKADFSSPEGVEILIVVDKLLTGFDEPRNTVLYLDKPLKEHGLLQAIARVNRLFEGKEFGYIVDYRGVLGELNEAMDTYNALEAFDAEDVLGTFTDVSEEIKKLPQRHSELWAVFKTVPNKKDVEALERFLEPEDKRQEFYEALTAFASSLKVALSTVAFFEETPEPQINAYKADLRFFHNLRASVRQRYAETIDYKDYEQKVRKLMDSHIKSSEVKPITELVNIFDAEKFDAEVARIEGLAAKADTIANRIKKTAAEKMEQDPAFYKKFSRMIDETIEAYKAGRLSELEYLKQMEQTRDEMRTGQDETTPQKLRRYKHAPAYFGVIREPLGQYSPQSSGVNMEELMADLAIKLEEIIERKKVRDWVNNLDTQNQMKREMEDYLVSLKDHYEVPMTYGDIDLILDSVIEVARQRDQL
ncbi:MAG: restriction endonuclease subunit R [Anaerolineae bacterium]|nr:type I restriction endonuclease subunit R [Anaerolineales bacterium]MCQ3976512.1 restriction endonuclease subunit R [Anaerolineae bacterium]